MCSSDLFADTKRRHGVNYGYVASYDFVYDDRLALGASGRYDQNYRFADAFTYHLQASYRFDNGLRPHAALGSGFKAPGIYELYGYTPGPGSYVGNPNLKPERSVGWELGFDQRLFDGMVLAGDRCLWDDAVHDFEIQVDGGRRRGDDEIGRAHV